MGHSDGRKQVRRILKIIERLQKSTNGIRVRDLADFYGVDVTRIYEDIKIIKDFCELKNKQSLYWIEPKRPPRWSPITVGEGNALKSVIDASPLAKEKPFADILKSVLERIHKPLAKHIREKIEQEVGVSIQLKTGNRYDEIEKYFAVLEEALYKQKEVCASYLPAGKAAPITHLLQPYAIFFRKEDWYLEARSNLSENASLTFKILRFRGITLTDETFDLPTNFSLSENLASRWELFSGKPINITLRIAAHKAYLVTEKERHQSQKIIERCPDGGVVVRYEVPKEEFTFWVLSLGDAVEVLDPPEFRAEFREIVRRMHAIYFKVVDGTKVISVNTNEDNDNPV